MLWNRLRFSWQEAGRKTLSLNEAILEAKPGVNLPSYKKNHVQEDQVLYRQVKLILCLLTSALCSYLAFSWVYALALKPSKCGSPPPRPFAEHVLNRGTSPVPSPANIQGRNARHGNTSLK